MSFSLKISLLLICVLVLATAINSKSMLRSKAPVTDCTNNDGEECTTYSGKTGWCRYDPHVGDNYCAYAVTGLYENSSIFNKNQNK